MFNAAPFSSGVGSSNGRKSVTNPFANVGGGNAALATARQFGWADQGNGIYRKGDKTMTPEELSAQLPRLGAIQQGSDPNSYSSGVNYQSAIQPYMSNASASAGGGASSVNQSNEYANKLKALMANPDSIQNTGAYQFQYNQGQQALERSAAAKGMSGSGNVLAELMKYGQGQASQAYDTEANRLAALAGNENQFILGKMGAANTETGTKAQANSLLAQLSLNASKAQADDYWNKNKLAMDTGISSGYLKQQAW